ncbi:MAG: isochorismatase [Gammaproteobacteria bacterium RIFCSPHIGHO2_12_FULL_41_20]|nr:MAG: isochorismatase [Gammaproteobacteria bacterium RIFCSPHIGHO2_12_FULL_41_20]
MNTALLLLEIQNDYFPMGKMPLEKSNDAVQKAQAILHAFRDKKLPIIHVQHISTRPDASYLLPCTKGAEFHPHVQPTKNEAVIKKHYPNSFKDTSLLNTLMKSKINHLLICGMTTHLTVDATVRAAYDAGFSCTVLHDACATLALQFEQDTIAAQQVQHAFLAALQPTYATVLNTAQCLQKLGTKAMATA